MYLLLGLTSEGTFRAESAGDALVATTTTKN